jgi:transcriptional regulator with XRE-family HTH domain
VAVKRTQEDIFLNLNEARAFARHLRRIRKEKGLTQEDLAFEANVDRVTIGRIETARQNLLLIRS